MTSEEWREVILAQLENKGMDDELENPTIDTLATIMEERDRCWELYQRSGGNPVINHTNKYGATNLERNPLLRTWIDLNQQSLTYWRELGLTPSSFKKLTDEPIQRKKAGDPVETKILEILGA